MDDHISNISNMRALLMDHTFMKILETSENGLKVFCEYCSSTFEMTRTNHLSQLIGGKKHNSQVSLKRSKQKTLSFVPGKKRVENTFNRDLTHVWIGAGLPLSAFRNKPRRIFLENKMARKVPCDTVLRTTYADWGYSDLMKKIKKEVIFTDKKFFYSI